MTAAWSGLAKLSSLLKFGFFLSIVSLITSVLFQKADNFEMAEQFFLAFFIFKTTKETR